MKGPSRKQILAHLVVAGLASLMVAAAPTPAASPSPKARTPKAKRAPVARPSPRPSATPSPRSSPSPSPRAFTNDDLAGTTDGKGTLTVLAPPLFPPPEAAPEGNPVEREWRARAQVARSSVQVAEAALQAAEARLSALTSDLDPNANFQDPNRLQTLQQERAKAVEARDAASAALTVARQAQDDLEEAARRAGIDRRWLSGNER